MCALIWRLPIALLAVVTLWTLSAVPTHAADESGPVTVSVRFWLNDILKFDPATGFTVDAFMGFVCDRPCGDLGIVIGNGKVSSRDLLADLPNAKVYRMELALTDVIDLHQYPFDKHDVEIDVISARPAEQLQFAVDSQASGVGTIKLQGWEVDPRWHADVGAVPNDPFAQRTIPAYQFTVTLQRPPLAGFFKTILPALAILLVGSFGLILGPEERIKRFDLFNAAFLGTVLFQLSIQNSLPPLAYLTFADRFLLVNLISIILGVASSVWIILAYRAGARSRALDVHQWALTIVPLVWLSLQSVNVLANYVLSANDPRLWFVGVIALIVAAIILPLRHRAMRTDRFFRSAYRAALRQTRSPQTALTQVLDIVGSKPPFDALAKSDLDGLAEVFAPLPDPTVLADVLADAERTNDVAILKDRAALARFADHIASQGQRPPEHLATSGTTASQAT
jgi:hypothetical protein